MDIVFLLQSIKVGQATIKVEFTLKTKDQHSNTVLETLEQAQGLSGRLL